MAQGMKVPAQIRLKHAKESLEDANNLIVQDVGANFVMNSVYYSFMFALFGLLEARGILAPMQNEMIFLFEREYVSTGQIETRFLDGIRKVFELRPVCDCQGKKKVTVKDIEELLPIADEFLALAERLVE